MIVGWEALCKYIGASKPVVVTFIKHRGCPPGIRRRIGRSWFRVWTTEEIDRWKKENRK